MGKQAREHGEIKHGMGKIVETDCGSPYSVGCVRVREVGVILDIVDIRLASPFAHSLVLSSDRRKDRTWDHLLSRSPRREGAQ